MEWRDVARLIAPLAPTAGSILGGFIPFPGGSFIGQKFGEMIAKQFGVEATPAAVAGAVSGSPNEVVLAKINAASAEARAQIDGFVEAEKAVQESIRQSLRETGVTMRLEMLPENRHWFWNGWRPATGWAFPITVIPFGLMLVMATGVAVVYGNDRPLMVLKEAWPVFLAFFGPLALVNGIFIPTREYGKVEDKKIAVEAAKAGVAVEPAKPVKPVPKPVPLPIDRNPRT